MTRDTWIRLASVDECPPGRAKFVLVGQRRLAIFHLADPDRFVVTTDECPHAGASLAAGEFQDSTVTCHWHAWTFDLHTGKCPMAEHVNLRRYECRVENEGIWVHLTP
jgi:nitrite reductase (NADH) small subunit